MGMTLYYCITTSLSSGMRWSLVQTLKLALTLGCAPIGINGCDWGFPAGAHEKASGSTRTKSMPVMLL